MFYNHEITTGWLLSCQRRFLTLLDSYRMALCNFPVFWRVPCKILASKTRFLSYEHQKSYWIQFCLHHFVSVCRMVTRADAFESPDLGGHCRYLEHVYLKPRKFFRGVWSRKLHFFLRSMKNGSKSNTSQIGKNRLLSPKKIFL